MLVLARAGAGGDDTGAVVCASCLPAVKDSKQQKGPYRKIRACLYKVKLFC